MKKIIALVLVSILLLLTACTGLQQNDLIETESTSMFETFTSSAEDLKFNSLEDPKLFSYVDNLIYTELDSTFENDDTCLYDINMSYVSKEYLEEVDYNSKKNIYFGYTLTELNEYFDGKKFVFTVGNNGKTTVRTLETYDNTYEKTILKNVCIGAGVILICVTVSTIATPGGAISLVFAASAKTATQFALGSTIFSGVVSFLVEGIKTGDVDAAIKKAVLNASEGFKWAAVSGALVGGAKDALSIYKLNHTIPSPREAELQVLKKYTGVEQIAFLDKVEVPRNTPNATCPDIIRIVGSCPEAIEVKRYDLTDNNGIIKLCKVLKKQISDRIKNLPDNYRQRIVLNTVGQNISQTRIKYVIEQIQIALQDIYPDIPVDNFNAVIA